MGGNNQGKVLPAQEEVVEAVAAMLGVAPQCLNELTAEVQEHYAKLETLFWLRDSGNVVIEAEDAYGRLYIKPRTGDFWSVTGRELGITDTETEALSQLHAYAFHEGVDNRHRKPPTAADTGEFFVFRDPTRACGNCGEMPDPDENIYVERRGTSQFPPVRYCSWCWADLLERMTVFTERESKVRSLEESGLDTEEIAAALPEASPESVAATVTDIRTKASVACWTAKLYSGDRHEPGRNCCS